MEARKRQNQVVIPIFGYQVRCYVYVGPSCLACALQELMMGPRMANSGPERSHLEARKRQNQVVLAIFKAIRWDVT